MVFSVLIGYGVSHTISRRLFEQHLAEQVIDEYYSAFCATPCELTLFTPGEMTVDEALALYDITLDRNAVAIFISVGTLVVLVSTIIPIWYALKLEPQVCQHL